MVVESSGLGGYSSFESMVYILKAVASCRPLLMQVMPFARALALESAGSSSAARMAMIAMTTSNSIRVKPGRWWFGADGCAGGRNAVRVWLIGCSDMHRGRLYLED